ncbi:transglutaminase family protein [Streptomyces sp. NPDC003691]
MSGRGRLALCAFAATLMAASAMLPLVDSAGWLVQAAFLLAVQSGAGALARRLPLPAALTVAAQAVTGLLLLTVVFAGDRALLGVLPGPDTLARFGELLSTGGQDIERYAIPAPASEGIRLMLVAGVLAIGLMVDTIAVTFRSAAPAGLPLLALYSVAAGLAGGAASALWFLLAASGYLLLLLAESRDRLSQWGRVFAGTPSAPVRGERALGRGTPGAPVRTGRRIGALALGVALVVPLALPALDGGLLSDLDGGDGSGSGGGTINAVNPMVSLQNNLNQPAEREWLRYRTNAGDTSGLYLRLVALDRFDGSRWLTSERDVEDLPGQMPRPEGLSSSVRAQEVETRITAAGSFAQEWLPMPYPVTWVEAGGKWRFEPEGRTLVGDRGQNTRGLEYTVRSLLVQPTAQQLATAPAPPAALVSEYTRLPASLPKVVADTARQVTKGAESDYQAAVKLQEWFTSTGGFRYDTDVNSGSGPGAMARFLRDKEGFCVHFSAAMAAMARSLGIPARVAVGFTPGTARGDGFMSVSNRNAHAWPELYFEGVGWTRFEPTPSIGTAPDYTLPDAPSDGESSAPQQPEETASRAPAPTASAEDTCPADARLRGECDTSAAPGDAAATGSGGSSSWGPLLLVPAVAALLLLPLLPLLWRTRMTARRLGSRGRTGEDTAERALLAWREVTDTAWDHGILPDESLTARRSAVRIVLLGRLDGAAADSVHRVAGAVEQVLYAQEPRPVPGLVDDVARVRAGLAAGAGRWERIRARLFPRSAVRVLWALSARRSALAGRLRDRTGAWADRLPAGPRRALGRRG